MNPKILEQIGLTEGESKVYLALLKIGSSTSGPITDEANVSRSKIYNILERLIQKGLVSYIIKQKTRYYQAADPKRLLYFLDKEKEELENKRNIVENILPQLDIMKQISKSINVQTYEGYRGIQTAFENYEKKLKKGDEYLVLFHPHQKEHYHSYWKRHHQKRIKQGIKARMLFDSNVNKEILENRNSYKGCDARYLKNNIKSKSWLFIYADTLTIFLQEETEMAVEIVNQKVADTLKQVFDDYWRVSKPFKD